MTEFMIKSQILDKLRPKMEEAISLIQKTIQDKRPILVRHHADCDGYSGAVALERAILALMDKVHKRESDLFFYYKRLPSRAPFYDYTDATKDLSNFLQDRARFERKAPLIIVIDNGSSCQDHLALQKLKIYKAKIIVIDHHPVTGDNDSYIDVHINPMLVGGSSNLTAGMTSAEVAHLLNGSIDDLELLAAIAGVADRSEGAEINQYVKLAEKAGTDLNALRRIAEAIDYEAMFIGFLESRFLVNDLFFGNLENQEKLIQIIENEVKKAREKVLKTIEHYAKVTEADAVIATLDLELTRKLNSYPHPGKITGIMFDLMSERYARPVVALGHGRDFISFRIDRETRFDVNRIIEHLDKVMPYAQVDGGGHAKAGTVRFIPAAKEELFQKVLDYLRQ